MKILLFGRRGQVGRALEGRLSAIGMTTAIDRDDLDLVGEDDLGRVLNHVHPELIVNAAAYTDVDGAESDYEMAFQVNAKAPEYMAKWAARNDSAIVHFSTDYVFDGSGCRAWREVDRPNPLNVYGESKLAGDEAVLTSGAPCLVVRTSWIYSPHGKNFFNTMLRLGAERDTLRIVSDQVGAPTSAGFLATTTTQIVADLSRDLRDSLKARGGLVNITTDGETSWYGFAKSIFAVAEKRGFKLRIRSIEPMPTQAYPLPARRPLNSRLSLEALTDRFGIAAQCWRGALEEVFDQVPIVRC